MGRLTKQQRREKRKKKKAVLLENKKLIKSKHWSSLKPWEPVKMKIFTFPDIFPPDLSKEKRLEVIKEIGRKAKKEFELKYPTIEKWFIEYDPVYVLSYCA